MMAARRSSNRVLQRNRRFPRTSRSGDQGAGASRNSSAQQIVQPVESTLERLAQVRTEMFRGNQSGKHFEPAPFDAEVMKAFAKCPSPDLDYLKPPAGHAVLR